MIIKKKRIIQNTVLAVKATKCSVLSGKACTDAGLCQSRHCKDGGCR